MKYLDNLKKLNENDVEFDLLNENIPIAVANAFRRICLTEIIIPAIREKDITVYENTSYLNNGILENRISLIPLNGYENYDNIIFKLIVENKDDKIKDIMSSDIEFYKDGSKIDGTKYIPNQKILLNHLKKNEKINLEGVVHLSNDSNEEANYCPVSTIVYSFKKDEKKVKEELDKITDPLKKADYEIRDADRLYLQNKYDEPSVYQFSLESTGTFKPVDIFIKACNIIKEKLELLKESINTDDKNKVIIDIANFNLKSYDFLIFDEDDTLGNILTSYLLKDERIKFAGYDIPHPLDNKLIVRTSLEKENTKENNIKIMNENIDNIHKIIDEINEEWKKLF